MAAYTPIYTTALFVQAKAGLGTTELDLTVDANLRTTLEDAEKEVELLCGREFTDANSITEYLSINRKDILDLAQTSIVLSHYPIESISEFKLLDSSESATATFGTLTAIQIAAGTVYTSDYWLEIQNDPLTNSVVPNGKIKLKTNTIPEGTNNVKVTYTYGYSAVPVAVRNLATCLAAIRVWIAFLGGSYNYLNNYSIPQQTVNKGDLYVRGKQIIETLTEEANRLLERIGRRPRTLYFATGSNR